MTRTRRRWAGKPVRQGWVSWVGQDMLCVWWVWNFFLFHPSLRWMLRFMGLETPNNLEVDSKIEWVSLVEDVGNQHQQLPNIFFVPILIPLELGGLWVNKLKTTNSWVQFWALDIDPSATSAQERYRWKTHDAWHHRADEHPSAMMWNDVKWVWVNTYRYIFSGMNIHLPAILGFTRYQGFDPSPNDVKNPGTRVAISLGDFTIWQASQVSFSTDHEKIEVAARWGVFDLLWPWRSHIDGDLNGKRVGMG